MFITKAYLMQYTEHLNFHKKRFAKTLHEYIKTEEKNKSEMIEDEKNNKKENKEEILLIMRGNNPISE